MAAPLLFLTCEQARKSLAVFRSAEAGYKAQDLLPTFVAAKVPVGEAISRASGVHLPETPESVSDLEVFSNPKFHLDVVSTFLSIAMAAVEYVPNASYEGLGDAAHELKGFSDLISNLTSFGSFMPLVGSRNTRIDVGAGNDCKALLMLIQEFVGQSGIDSTMVIRDLLVQTASLTRKEATQTAFFGFHFEGAPSNPSLYLLYGTAQMLRTELGKSMATANQRIEISYHKYQLSSSLVSSMAEPLLTTILPAEALIKWINRRFLLPSE